MARYECKLDPAAARDMRRLKRRDRDMASRVADAIRGLANEPRPHGVEHLQGNTHRIRVGSYRVIYDVKDQEVLVLVLRIRHRRDVYRDLR